ncbi:class I SAM-dependent methyltransferase [Streptomyces rimosus]|uniref:class I SAM-dependent methyltransferase n=1 Tax=Streptomyces rimosus TaxID=1927 RepID=UPI0031D16BC9
MIQNPPGQPPDYELAYRGESAFGEQMPWDIPGPQPAYVEVEQAGLINGEILDCGCGTGENALFLAGKGYAVTGVDLSPTAVAQARRKATERGIDATFAVADALELTGYEGRFDTVVDSGMAHVFRPGELARYTAALHGACRRNAVVHVLGINEHRATEGLLADVVAKLGRNDPVTDARLMPMITVDALRTAFADGWTVESIRETPMHAVLPLTGAPTEVPGLLARITRT